MFQRLPFQYLPPDASERGDLEKWQDLYPPGSLAPANSAAADKWIGDALIAFQKFSRAYHDHFFKEAGGIITNNLFAAGTTRARLSERVLQAIEDYWTPLGRVAEQRQVKHYKMILDEGTGEATTYLRKLRLEALPVLIYFDKVNVIRHCPYASAIFIGAPYRLAVEKDWLAIPHELGHYLYWNLGRQQNDGQKVWTLGKLTDSRQWQNELKGRANQLIDARYPGLPENDTRQAVKGVIRSWLEEIFADLVGVQIGGTRFIDSLQNLIARSADKLDDMAENDGHHPPLILRLFLREATLKRIEAQGRAQPSAIDWEAFFKQAFNASRADIEARTIEAYLPVVRGNVVVAEEDLAPGEARPIHLEINELKSALEPILEMLNEEIEAFENELTPPVIDPETAFTQLIDLAGKERSLFSIRQTRLETEPDYERLLQPRILEGGETHTHGCWRHFVWHEEVGTHSH